MRARVASLFPDLGSCVEGVPGAAINDLDPVEVLSLFRSSAVVLFRGFDLSLETFRAFTDRCSSAFMPYAGGAFAREIVGGDATVMSVSTPSYTGVIPLHGEMYYRKQRPTILWFYCAQPAESGGATTVCDGRRLFAQLSPDTRKLFSGRGVTYVRIYGEGSWQKVFDSDDRDEVERRCRAMDIRCEFSQEGDGRALRTEYTTSAVTLPEPEAAPCFVNNILTLAAQERAQLALGFAPRSFVRLDDGSPIPSGTLGEIAAAAESCQHDIAWRRGDLAMIDNRRCLHGRQPFTGRREVFARLAFDPATG